MNFHNFHDIVINTLCETPEKQHNFNTIYTMVEAFIKRIYPDAEEILEAFNPNSLNDTLVDLVDSGDIILKKLRTSYSRIIPERRYSVRPELSQKGTGMVEGKFFRNYNVPLNYQG